ncbi:MAG: dTDP-4-dehydrorhamnose 3,5-epimerase [Saprospiraceae bacterium]|nr:dTDP-4-dehydrorhamnose 3,5-epimerase [Saprospiraceae bacterium]
MDGLVVIEPRVFSDARGAFFETYQAEKYEALGLPARFVQDNEAISRRGVLRGLHYQIGAFAQGKLVRVVTGRAFDVAVDIRPGSPTYGAWYGLELSETNKKQLFIPRGFAHGYLALEEDTILCYKCDNFYSREHEGGIRYDDPAISVAWPDIEGDYILSEKDLALPGFGDHRS